MFSFPRDAIISHGFSLLVIRNLILYITKQVSRSPSDVEVILGVIKSYSKSKLGTDGATSAAKHIQLLEVEKF